MKSRKWIEYLYEPKMPLKKRIRMILTGRYKAVKKHERTMKKYPFCSFPFDFDLIGDIRIGRHCHFQRGFTGHTFGRDVIEEPGVVIGNFCSFAKGVYINTRNHPVKRVSLFPIQYLVGTVDPDKPYHMESSENRIIIGNDVWIGADAKVLVFHFANS